MRRYNQRLFPIGMSMLNDDMEVKKGQVWEHGWLGIGEYLQFSPYPV